MPKDTVERKIKERVTKTPTSKKGKKTSKGILDPPVNSSSASAGAEGGLCFSRATLVENTASVLIVIFLPFTGASDGCQVDSRSLSAVVNLECIWQHATREFSSLLAPRGTTTY